MTSIFLIIFVLHGGQPYSVEAGQFETAPACQASMEEVFDDLQAQGFPARAVTGLCVDSGLAVEVSGMN
jgi:hypothetical protein